MGTDDKSRERIHAGSHPDVRVFRPRDEGRRNIPVDQLRQQILPVAQFAPFEASAAFLIFPEADVSFPEHPPESANAILKTLEEPRPGVHFLLLSERPDRLLPTIRSRCQRVRFSRLPPSCSSASSRIGASSRAPGGPPSRSPTGAPTARALAEGGADELLEAALELDEVCTSGGPGALVRASEALVRGDTELPVVLDAWMLFSRDLAAAALGLPDEKLAFRHRADAVRERAARISPARAARRADLVRDALVALERNGNPQVVVDSLLYSARL